MADHAQVKSIDAIDSFRASLLIYIRKAQLLLEDAEANTMRMRSWLQMDQRVHWQNELRRRRKAFDRAQEAFFSASIAGLRDPRHDERSAVQRAKQQLEEAEEKLKRVNYWNREFDRQSEFAIKRTEQLRTLLFSEMPRAAAHLAQIIRTLEQYAGTHGHRSDSTSNQQSETTSRGEEAEREEGKSE